MICNNRISGKNLFTQKDFSLGIYRHRVRNYFFSASYYIFFGFGQYVSPSSCFITLSYLGFTFLLSCITLSEPLKHCKRKRLKLHREYQSFLDRFFMKRKKKLKLGLKTLIVQLKNFNYFVVVANNFCLPQYCNLRERQVPNGKETNLIKVMIKWWMKKYDKERQYPR